MLKSRPAGRPARLAGPGRKLVRAFPSSTTVLEDNECMKAAKEICYGLAVFRANFGYDDEDPDSTFHGFSPHEIRWATDKSQIRNRQVENEHRARGALFAPFTFGRFTPLSKSSSTTTSPNSSSDVQNNQVITSSEKTPNSVSKVFPKENFLKKKILKQHLQRTSKCGDKHGATSNNNSELNKRFARKFVLPVRSVHSSRVIKPNKRFRDIDGDTTLHDASERRSYKKMRLTNDTDDDSSSSWIGKRTGESSDGESMSGWSSSISTAGSSVKDEDVIPKAAGKVILRKAKLRVGPDPPAIKGPFSSGGGDTLVPQKVVCGVCGAIRYYRYLKQARKFGIYSCETCRKFISKSIHQLGSTSVLGCKTNTGKCVLPHYMKDPETGIISHNRRCTACWLKMCLHCYCMPENLTRKLKDRLPEFMRDSPTQRIPKKSSCDQKKRDKLKQFSSSRNISSMVMPSKVERQLLAKDIRQRAEVNLRKDRKMKSENNIPVITKVVSNTKPSFIAKKITIRGDLRVSKVKRKYVTKDKKLKKLEREARLQKKREEKLVRLQKLKGPRVKHVCRSASLVLGQPVATFTDTSPSKLKQSNSGREVDDENTSITSFSGSNRNLDETSSNTNAKLTESGSRIRQPSDDAPVAGKNKSAASKNSVTSDSTEENPLDGKARTLQDLTRQHYELVHGDTTGDDGGLISIDFWESYDPEEVCKTGFALIGMGDSFNTSAICFICGSAGLDKLIHCSTCCEPYHSYCVEGGTMGSREEGDWWQVDWVCSRCTLCRGCGQGGGAQVACQKCHKSYHTECLAADRVASRLHSADRPWVCLSCLCCKSCNQAEVYKFVGNLPLCRVCFKLRQKGNFCPLCQRCYDENDFDTKMMECERCKCWVHAKCEGLSNEKYHILSILPDSVEFVCRLCCKMPPAPWWLAVESEMKAGFLAVMKSLSKNRKACDLLKCSPTKMAYPVCTCGMRQRALRFPDLSEQSDVESSDMQRVQSENQKEETANCEEECLKSLPNFSTVKTENLVCDPKTESSGKLLALCDLRTKYNVRECSVLMKNDDLQLKLDSDTISYQNSDEKPAQFSPHATSQSDSGIGSTDDELKSTNDQCFCLELEPWSKTPPTLLNIKKKINSNEYNSLECFNKEMEEMILNIIQNKELLNIYYQTLEDIFPWFNPKCCEVFDPTMRMAPQPDAAKTVKAISDEKPDEGDVENVSVTLKGKLNLNRDYYYDVEEIKDSRICILCKQVGEGIPTEEGRLLYCGQNEWVHTNCALWSNEVFEEIDGSLQNVQSAISRSRHIRCSKCSKKGASVGCCNRSCPEAYHFTCAKHGDCVFYEDKSLFCANHKDDTVSSRPLVTGPDFLVSRPVYVELERKKKKYVAKHNVHVMIGSLTISALGDFDPDLSDQECSIIPCNFQCTRLFWSSVEPWRLVQYSIKTKIVYTISDSSVETDNNFTIDHSLPIWEKIEEIKWPQEDFCDHISQSEIRELLDYMVDVVSSKEEEDPQASTDLLPPELKEAIFEDLPHDLLDGISMQDIFPKLMNFDSSALDLKPEKECKTATRTNSFIQNTDKIKSNTHSFTNMFESKVPVKSYDIKRNAKSQLNRSPKKKIRTQSEILRKGDKFEEKENSKKWSLSKILQIDGAGDCSSESSDLGSPVSEKSDSPPPSQIQIPTFNRSYQSCNFRTSRILQVDGIVDSDNTSSSSSECSSPGRDDESLWKLGQLDGASDFCNGKDKTDEDPVKCTRCHRTYRTAQSLERHLQTCNVDFLSCSESDSSEEDKTSTPEVKLSDVENVMSNSLKVPEKEENVKESSIPENNHQIYTNFSDKISCENNLSTQQHELSFPNNKITSNPSHINITQTSNQSHVSTNHSARSSPLTYNNLNINKSENQHNYPPKPKTIRASFECEDSQISPSSACGNSTSGHIRPVKTYSRKKRVCTSTAAMVSPINSVQQKPMEYQMSTAPPTLIIQQVPTHNVVPSYIESVPGNQYQYIATLQEKPQIPLTVQIQPSISLQPVMPTVVGTLIQPNGVERLVVNTATPTVEMINQQPTNVYITNVNQPVYMGMETVISNTVMSSSQFVSGMLTGSSYSATTTQVFQTAKPVIDLPQSYVVVNTQTNPVSNTLPQPLYPPANSQPWAYNYQETYKVKERTTYQQVTRQIIQEESNLDCVKMVNSTEEAIFIDKPIVQEVTVEKMHSIKKTGPVPGLPNSFNNLNPVIINERIDNKQYSHEKMVFNNTANLCHCQEPKIQQINYMENIQHQQKWNQVNSRIDGTLTQGNNVHPVAQHMNKTEENVIKVEKVVKNAENKIETCNLEKYSKPVITKVKSNPNAKHSNFSINLSSAKPNHLNYQKHTPVVVKDSSTIKEHSMSLPKKTVKYPNNSSTKLESIKVDNQKKPDDKRLPLKENKVVPNKSKPSKENKKRSTAANLSHPKLMYEITSQDGLSICSQDVVEAWQKIFEAVQAARAEKRLPPLPQNAQKSHLRLLGLDNNSVKYLLEQLPGVKSCKNYKPVYHKTKLFGQNERLQENPSGCARSESIANKKRKYDMFSWLASRHRRPPKLIVNSDTEIVNGISRRATSLNLPMAMRFRHLKETSKEAVGVFRSDIHGRGLFCLRDIDSGEMVIEYAGEVIRAGLTDKREHYYTAKGIGCYMFRIDDQFVVDATMHGNAARFINHSCEPNCYSRVVDILGKKHILIFALRKISQGEELTYDYKFPLEDDKISCHCLSRKCRKYLN